MSTTQPRPKDIVIISDLHIAGGVLNDFDPEAADHLASFLNHLCRVEAPCELIINGDFLDFVQTPPFEGKDLEAVSADGKPLCFTEAQSFAKWQAIEREHLEVFRCLNKFLCAKDDNVVTILPGNHDADLFWLRIQMVLVKALSGGDRGIESKINLHLDRIYRPAACPSLWVEHGHQYDPINSFYFNAQECWGAAIQPIFLDDCGVQRLLACLGTQFLIRFLNGLDADYPFVDNVKPFSRFLALFGGSAFSPGFGPLKAAISVMGILRYLAKTGISNPKALLNMPTPNAIDGPEQALKTRLRTLPAVALEQLASRLNQLHCAREESLVGRVPLQMVLRDERQSARLIRLLEMYPNILDGLERKSRPDYLSTAGTPGTLSLYSGFQVNETEDLKRAARKNAENPCVDLVIMGHTHESVRAGKGKYINTGSWTRYLRFDGLDVGMPWWVLQKDSWTLFPYQLNYAYIRGQDPRTAELVTFAEKKR